MQTRRLDSPIVGLLVFHEATVRFSLSRIVSLHVSSFSKLENNEILPFYVQ